jgi:thymidylate kinase
VHHGFTYLTGEAVLASRRLDRGGFFVPSAALESLGILLHCVIDVGTIRPSYHERLCELGVGDASEFRAAAEAVVGPKLALMLAQALTAGEPARVLPLRGPLMRACAMRTPAAAKRYLRARAGAVADKLAAFVNPPGHLVILVGPDGCGKTTSAELVCKRFAATRVPVSAVYLGAQKPLLPTRKLSQKLRKRRAQAGAPREVKDVNRRQRLRGLVHIMADKWARYLLQVRPRLVRGEVVVLDRYFYDLRVFPHPLVRKGFVEALVMACIPEPALAFCLTADPALITARKNELTVAETTRQIECYRGLTRWVRNFAELPADGDRVKVIDRMSADVLALYAGQRAPERI